MRINEFPKIKKIDKKRVGRGIGSGKGKTSGRGMKGQKARGKIPAANVGAGLILYKKLPYRRGYSRTGQNKSFRPETIEVKIPALNIFKPQSVVNMQALVENKIINAKQAQNCRVKLLAEGELNVALTVELKASKKAQEMIEKAGGKIVS